MIGMSCKSVQCVYVYLPPEWNAHCAYTRCWDLAYTHAVLASLQGCASWFALLIKCAVCSQ